LEPVAPPIDTLVAWAVSRAPEIAVQRHRAAAGRERAAAEGALTDPVLELFLENASFSDYTVGEEEMSILGVELRQDLPWPGKRRSRRRAAEAASSVEAVEMSTVERRVTSEVQVLCARLYAVDRSREVLAASREIVRLLESGVTARYGAAQAEMEAQIKAQLASSRLEERLTDLTAERRSLAAELDRYLGPRAGTSVGRFIVLPEPAPPPGDWLERAATNTPALQAARAAVTAAAAELEAEQQERRPDLFVGAGYGYRGGFDPMLSLRVGSELPIWRGGRQEPRVRAAEHDRALRNAEVQRLEAEARAEAERLVAAWEVADEQVRRYGEAIVPQSRIALEAARTSYSTGKSDFSTVVEDFELWIDAQQQLARREADRYAARARLEALIAPWGTTSAREAGR
jgi:outer membrane protein TolC